MTVFDYSPLHEDLRVLSKPAQRALLNNGIKTPKQLAGLAVRDVLAFHGMGKASVPIMTAALKKHGLTFKG